MIYANLFLVICLLVLGSLVYRRMGVPGLVLGANSALGQGQRLAYRLPLALLAAAFLAKVVPFASFSHLIGPQSGMTGIVLASVLGGLIPGGPMVSFPIAIAILGGGAGLPQTASLIAGWSILAMHRLLAYEAPIMGWRFVALRYISCAVLPVLAGWFMALTMQLLDYTPHLPAIPR